MLFTVERYAIRASARYLRRCFSTSVDVSVNHSREVAQQSNGSPTSITSEAKKSLRIAFLGAPNVGKSTLVNQLIKRSVCPVSCKVHTTQAKAHAIYCEGDTQLVFMDTPGMVSEKECKKFKLAGSFKADPKASLQAAEVVGIVQDAENIYTRHKINWNILGLLTEDVRKRIPVILIINKVDRLKKKDILLDFVHTLTNSKVSPDFSDVFMISALTGDGVDDLRTYLLDSAQPRAWEYEGHVYSDNTCEDIIRQTVRAKLMDILPNEIPYGLQVKLEHFDPGPDDSIKALVSVTCPTKRIARLLTRGSNNRIGQIAVSTEEALRHAFRTSVRLKLAVQSPT
ncbi:PREDICTED: GTPase Era, mitochondrial [Vollenhovia emeryi]|uniref:GTPase Era, mitochondrial n=1 Tax=Vollenhovia emeryi TaxID=411798 RepID=UPI0005F3CBB1|nr:PREDICTED: GTPase Era, mitochondrial [Vollenhovia emeryi]XP_011882987.1 PREDICTED: GTPase Era, mitochondrial [Vollenhovia emeryi]XP_011882988.1 PREDICTED: GTPase Era, mitochondrial [Vollenhovia emeryi]